MEYLPRPDSDYVQVLFPKDEKTRQGCIPLSSFGPNTLGMNVTNTARRREKPLIFSGNVPEDTA